MKEYFIQEGVSLRNYSTMKIDAVAHTILLPYSLDGLRQVFNDYKQQRIIIVGGGSNMIFIQDYYSDEFAFVSTKMLESIELRKGSIYAQCGVTLSVLAWFALEKSIKDFSFLEDIPGTIGGAIIMNAGTYEDCIGNLVQEVTWYDIESDLVRTFQNANLFFKRDSVFAHMNGIVLGACLKALPGDYEKILKELLETKKKRYLKQPRNYPNAGSVFKRPYKNCEPLYVWKLFDDVGLRGYSVGGAMVSEKHPGFIVNTGRCTGSDILKLLDECKIRVYKKYQIELELEWKLI